MVLVESSGELGYCGRHFDSGEQNPFLPLEGDILRPPHKSGQISFGLDVVAHAEVARLLLEEGIGLLLNLLGAFLSLHSFSLNQPNITIDAIKIIILNINIFNNIFTTLCRYSATITKNCPFFRSHE